MHNTPKGYTLIEIIISLVIGSLLILAITSLYIYTNNLNQQAREKLNHQQDIVLLTNTISKDASMAGNFACLSLGDINSPDNINNDYTFYNLFFINYKDKILPQIATDRPNSKFNNTIPKKNESFGVFLTDSANLKNLNKLKLKQESPVLIFFYGSGSTGINNINISNNNKLKSISFKDGDINKNVYHTNKLGGFLALSSCKALNIFKGNKKDFLSFNEKDFGDIDILNEKIIRNQYDLERVNHHLENEISLLKLNVIAYFLAKDYYEKNTNNKYNFYRLEMAYDGSWETPQIMLKNVINMDIKFLYATSFDKNNIAIGCPSAFDIKNNNELNNYKIVKDKNHFYKIKNDFKISPASLDLILNLDNNNQFSYNNSNTIKISALIHGGNTCANRKLTN